MQGKLKTFFPDRGFGFIRPDDGSPDIFFHRDGSPGFDPETVERGTILEFDVAPDRKRATVRAVNLRVPEAVQQKPEPVRYGES